MHGLKRSHWFGLIVLAGLAHPAPVQAHGAIPGMEGVANGLLHPLTTPAHVLIMLGLGLLIGQRVPLDLKTPLFVLVPALAVGLLCTLSGKITEVYLPILLAMALVLAVLVALQKSIAPSVMRILSAICAIAIGLDSGIESVSKLSVLKTLFGTWVSVSVLVFNAAYYGSLAVIKTEWLKIGVRVLGSWIIAITLLMLAFSLRR